MIDRATTPLDPRHTALVFFDMIKRHVYGPDLVAPMPEARAQVQACIRVLAASRGAALPVFYVCADHRPDGRDMPRLLRDLPSQGEVGPASRNAKDPAASNVIDELRPMPADYMIFKHRWSMFFQTELELSLRARDIDTILLAGGSTEVGIA